MQRELSRIETEREGICHTLSQTPDDDANMPPLLALLGVCHGKRFGLLGELEDIEQAIEFTAIALTLTTDGHPGLSQILTDLGAFYCMRFQCRGLLDDIEQALEYTDRALALTPDGHPGLSRRLANLGAFYLERFCRLGSLGDLEKGTDYGSRALVLTPESHPDMPDRLTNMGILHGLRYKHLGEPDGLDQAVKYQNHALELTPDQDSRLPSRLMSLAVSHSERFDRFGGLEDLDKLIEYQSRALALTPESHTNLPDRLARLGEFHNTRFLRLGELRDLEKALEYKTRALALTPDGHPDLPIRLSHLGQSYSYRFLRLAKLGDLEKAIAYESQALALTPDVHPNFSNRLSGLGLTYLHRFERLGVSNDLEAAIEHMSRARELTPISTKSLPNLLTNLGVAHGIRFELLGTLEDLAKSIEYASHALALTPKEHPHMPWRHHSLAKYYFIQSHHPSGDHSDAQKSLNSFRQSQRSTGSPRDKFKFALEWVHLAHGHSCLNPIEAYQTTIDLLPQFVWLGSTTNQRYEDLSKAGNLAVDAAAAAIIDSNYSLALEWLEQTRCVVWNQSVLLRSPLGLLQPSDPRLADQLETVAHQLHCAGTESREYQVLASTSITPEEVIQQHHRLAEEYDNLVSQAHRLPGFENFLQSMKANDLNRAAKTGPIVVINCHGCRCDALLVLPGQDNITHIPLPNFTGEKAQQARFELQTSLRRKGIRERGVKIRQDPGYGNDLIKNVLAVLWTDVVKPVIDFLGYTNDVSMKSQPHITWCPTGVVSFLPLHAAGDYSQPRSRVFDYVISSYTPTLTALLASTPSSPSHNPRLLAVGLESTPAHTPLPGIVKELAYIEAQTQRTVECTQLINDQATTTAVLDAMEQHDWVHLACHAHQNVVDPTKSGFFLHDGTLDLASISRRSFKNKGLAFLSACQTATGDEKLPDEAIHLASGMLMAGYPSVIATMWSVSDADAPFVADKVYGQLMKAGMIGNGEAGRALHNAVGELRDRVGEKEFGRWVPYIHIGL